MLVSSFCISVLEQAGLTLTLFLHPAAWNYRQPGFRSAQFKKFKMSFVLKCSFYSNDVSSLGNSNKNWYILDQKKILKTNRNDQSLPRSSAYILWFSVCMGFLSVGMSGSPNLFPSLGPFLCVLSNSNVIIFVLSHCILFCYNVLSSLRNLFFSNERQKVSGSNRRRGREEMGGVEGGEPQSRYTM